MINTYVNLRHVRRRVHDVLHGPVCADAGVQGVAEGLGVGIPVVGGQHWSCHAVLCQCRGVIACLPTQSLRHAIR